MSKRHSFRIRLSAGHPRGTVHMDGKEIHGITAIKVESDVKFPVPLITLVLCAQEVDVELEDADVNATTTITAERDDAQAEA